MKGKKKNINYLLETFDKKKINIISIPMNNSRI